MMEKIKTLVRPIIALSFVGVACYLFITGKLKPEDVLPITGIVIGFYFGERAAIKKEKPNG